MAALCMDGCSNLFVFTNVQQISHTQNFRILGNITYGKKFTGPVLAHKRH